MYVTVLSSWKNLIMSKVGTIWYIILLLNIAVHVPGNYNNNQY